MTTDKESSLQTADTVPGHQWLSSQIREHGAMFFRVARRVVRDRATAEDICQTAYVRALEKPGVEAGALKAWLVRTVLNLGLEVLRRRKTEQRVLGDKAHVVSAQSRADARTEPLGGLTDLVLNAVQNLPEASKAVVMLRLFEGLSGNETKEILGCSAGEVSKQLHRGMEQLRTMLGDELSGYR